MFWTPTCIEYIACSCGLCRISAKFRLHYGDMTDSSCLVKIISEVRPTEIYNLAAQSHVKVYVHTYYSQISRAQWLCTGRNNFCSDLSSFVWCWIAVFNCFFWLTILDWYTLNVLWLFCLSVTLVNCVETAEYHADTEHVHNVFFV